MFKIKPIAAGGEISYSSFSFTLVIFLSISDSEKHTFVKHKPLKVLISLLRSTVYLNDK